MDWPAEVLTVVDNRHQGFSTELILSSYEEIDADDGKDGEDEALEYHDIKQAGYWGNESLDKDPHAFQLMHGT